jgi:phosphatidylserine/phosphatidylglycerophosphate/cardiolipin synthase-like enzyme
MTVGERPDRRRSRFDITTRPLVYGGNRIRLLENGDEYFPNLLAAIEGAARSIYLETYIFAQDNIGLRVSDALSVAADRGVEVRIIVDGFGTGAHAETLKSHLESVGGQVMCTAARAGGGSSGGCCVACTASWCWSTTSWLS